MNHTLPGMFLVMIWASESIISCMVFGIFFLNLGVHRISVKGQSDKLIIFTVSKIGARKSFVAQISRYTM